MDGQKAVRIFFFKKKCSVLLAIATSMCIWNHFFTWHGDYISVSDYDLMVCRLITCRVSTKALFLLITELKTQNSTRPRITYPSSAEAAGSCNPKSKGFKLIIFPSIYIDLYDLFR
jgi:hypothetical protein